MCVEHVVASCITSKIVPLPTKQVKDKGGVAHQKRLRVR